MGEDLQGEKVLDELWDEDARIKIWDHPQKKVKEKIHDGIIHK